MGDRASATPVIYPILIAAALVLFQQPGRTQDRAAHPGPATARSSDLAGLEDRIDEQALRRLGVELRRARAAGDLSAASGILARMFTFERSPDPGSALKMAATAGSYRMDPASTTAEPGDSGDGPVPVFFSSEEERNPAAELCRGTDGRRALVSAAELWSGGQPRDIGVRRSLDGGGTWAGTLVLGDGRPRTQPSARQISDASVGLIFTREWDGGEGDIVFARLSEDLAAETEFPVALSPADQRNPSLATDFPAFPSPYVYAIYSERNGASSAVKFRVSPDLGASWSEAVTVAASAVSGDEKIETALAYDADRHILLAAFTWPQGRSTGIAVATSRTCGASWSDPVFVTPAGGGPSRSPRIAARRGEAVIVHEQTTAGGGTDIGLAVSSNSGRSWTAGSLASTAADERFPDVRASEETGGGRFLASYVEAGARVRVLGRDAAGGGPWTTDLTFETGSAPVKSGPVAVVPLPSSGGQSAAGIFWTGGDPDSDVLFGTAATLVLADLVVTPGNQNVPYTAGTTSFTVSKSGGGRIEWTAAVVSGQDWLFIQSGASGDNSGTIVAGFPVNPAPGPRSGSIRVSAPGNTVFPDTVTVTQAGAPALEVSPADGFSSTGPQGGSFVPASKDYTLQNPGGSPVAWAASANRPWLSLSPVSGLLDPGASVVVTVSFTAEAAGLGVGEHDATIAFANGSNGLGDTSRPVSLTVTGPLGTLQVTPAEGLISTGLTGGPFAPSGKAYTLQNTGTTPIDWTAAKIEAWTSLSNAAGSLGPGASVTVTVSVNAAADSLTAGTYDDTITFTNTTNGNGTTTRPVTLTVSAPPGVLAVTPAEGLASSGPEGGPFSPSSRTYTLQNSGPSALAWTASKAQAWLSLSATAGTLAAGDAATVIVSVNGAAGALSAGSYADTVSFVNRTTGNGSTTRPVTLTVQSGPALSVSPAHRELSFAGGTATFDVANSGAGTMPWTAAVISGSDWLHISAGSSGTDAGTIVATAAANGTSTERTGTIRITAPGAAGSPKDVTVSQVRSSLVLSLSAARRIDKAWIIQREFVRLTVGIDNPAAVPVETYAVFRRAGGGAETMVKQVDGSTVTGSPLVIDDASVEPGISYTYRVAALDATGRTLAVSNEITIE